MKPRRGQQFIKSAGEQETEGDMEAGRGVCQGREMKAAMSRQVRRILSMRPSIFYFLFELFQWGSSRQKKREGERRRRERAEIRVRPERKRGGRGLVVRRFK